MATLQQPLAGFSTQRTVDLSSRDVQERLSRSAIPAFFKLAHAWQLRDESTRQLLGGVSNGVFYQLKRGHKKTLDQDKLTRISLLLGIFKALNILYSRKLADAWVNLPNSNPMFEGEAPLLPDQRRSVLRLCAFGNCWTRAARWPVTPKVTTIRQDDTHRLIPSRYSDESVLGRLAGTGRRSPTGTIRARRRHQ